jgi:hypothetical protein
MVKKNSVSSVTGTDVHAAGVILILHSTIKVGYIVLCERIM